MVKHKLAQLLLATSTLLLSSAVTAAKPLWTCTTSQTGKHWDCEKKAAPVRYSSSLSSIITEENVYNLTLPEVATQLGWVSAPVKDNLCRGYYFKPAIPFNKSSAIGGDSVNFKSDRAVFSNKGTRSLLGNVLVTQPNRLISTNRAYVYPDPETNKPKHVKLEGNIHLRQPQTYVIASQGTLDFPTKAWQLDNILYQLTLEKSETNPEKDQRVTGVSAWGRARMANQTVPKIIDLYNASYSTCPPASTPAWNLYGKHIHLDKNTGRGYITNGLFYIKGTPVFYWPYFNFPIDDRRQTGFLSPTYGHSTRSGDELTVPFYWNLAPNYDATITPLFMDQRGIQLTTQIRYITKQNRGNFSYSIIPNDRKFRQFKQTEAGDFPAPTTAEASALDDLERANTTRSSLAWRDNIALSPNLSAGFDYNWVSDDYYLMDLSNSVYAQTDTQLPQNAQITYQDSTHQLIVNVQHYQTLHPVNEAAVSNQYTRIPQIKFATNLPRKPYAFDFSLKSDFNYFDISRNPGQSFARPKGSRLNINPIISLPLARPGMYVTPRVQFLLTSYKLIGPGTNGHGREYPSEPTRGLPVFDIDAGLKFERNATLFHREYTQTLEPQIYYLYTPYENQNDLPLFDSYDTTQPLAFTYDQMFRPNRFTSIDRIGDTNQLTLALTTRFLDKNTANERFRASIGEIIYFEKRKTLLCSNNPADANIYPTCSNPPSQTLNANTQDVSPIAGLVSYKLYNHWQLLGGMAYNQTAGHTDNQNLSLSYHGSNNRLFNIGYTFAREGDIIETFDGVPTDSAENDLQQSTVSASWPLTDHISVLGQWGYNWSHHHMQNYVYGMQYESCCFAVRFVGTRTFTGLDQNLNNQYDKAFFVQFALKGLSRLGFNDPSGTIASNIDGYQDNFGRY